MKAVETPMPRLVHDDYDSRDHYEIIDGLKIEMPSKSVDSQVLASRVVRHLSNYGINQNIGEAYAKMLFKLPQQADKVQKPDAAFVSYSRWPKNQPFPSTASWSVLPELFVEVVSLNDMGDEIESKIDEYFQAGVRLVWVIYPRQARFYVYESPSKVRRLTRADTLDGGPVLPGFALPLSELFAQPQRQ